MVKLDTLESTSLAPQTQFQRVLQSIAEYYRVLQSILTSLAPQTQFQVLRTNNYYTRVSPLAIISCIEHDVRTLLFYSTTISYLLVFYQRSKVAAKKNWWQWYDDGTHREAKETFWGTMSPCWMSTNTTMKSIFWSNFHVNTYIFVIYCWWYQGNSNYWQRFVPLTSRAYTSTTAPANQPCFLRNVISRHRFENMGWGENYHENCDDPFSDISFSRTGWSSQAFDIGWRKRLPFTTPPRWQ